VALPVAGVVIAPVEWLRRIDDWRRRQAGLPSRSEAIRQLVTQALDADAPGKGDKKPKG
jgi:hypothetical protein